MTENAQKILDLVKESKLQNLNNEKILKSLPTDFANAITKSIGEVTTPYLENILYSLKLKNVPIIDVAIIVVGFVLRLIFGGIISNIPISNWLYLVVIAISFYMGYGKRRNEILMQKEETRAVLKNYSYEFLDKNMHMSSALAIVFYALWCVENSSKYAIVPLLYRLLVFLLLFFLYIHDSCLLDEDVANDNS